MSRTFVHLPHWVKTRAPEWRRYFTEDHRHGHGPCDLDRFDPRAPWSATRCHLDIALADRNFTCGCRLCTGHHERAAARRAVRAAGRRFARQVVKTPPAGRDVLDPPDTRPRW